VAFLEFSGGPSQVDLRMNSCELTSLAQVINRMNEIDPDRETVVHCKRGDRRARTIEAEAQNAGVGGW
jgi:hypothetical protein